ncbi:hypothetical protein HDU85_003695 [Gaertneriomyces sp. JEL0708]|nr:hypothetical protein HDU85_003695 [Gaertneriomyces sp. JEL0708]
MEHRTRPGSAVLHPIQTTSQALRSLANVVATVPELAEISAKAVKSTIPNPHLVVENDETVAAAVVEIWDEGATDFPEPEFLKSTALSLGDIGTSDAPEDAFLFDESLEPLAGLSRGENLILRKLDSLINLSGMMFEKVVAPRLRDHLSSRWRLDILDPSGVYPENRLFSIHGAPPAIENVFRRLWQQLKTNYAEAWRAARITPMMSLQLEQIEFNIMLFAPSKSGGGAPLTSPLGLSPDQEDMPASMAGVMARRSDKPPHFLIVGEVTVSRLESIHSRQTLHKFARLERACLFARHYYGIKLERMYAFLNTTYVCANSRTDFRDAVLDRYSSCFPILRLLASMNHFAVVGV